MKCTILLAWFLPLVCNQGAALETLQPFCQKYWLDAHCAQHDLSPCQRCPHGRRCRSFLGCQVPGENQNLGFKVVTAREFLSLRASHEAEVTGSCATVREHPRSASRPRIQTTLQICPGPYPTQCQAALPNAAASMHTDRASRRCGNTRCIYSFATPRGFLLAHLAACG